MPHKSSSLSRIVAAVPSYNRREALEKCIEALLGQTRPPDSILVVDNASTDGTAEMVRTKFTGRAQLVRLPANTGSAGGFHEGIRIAYDQGYDWTWCMDNDAEPAPDSLEALTASPAFSDPRAGALAALVVDQHGKIQAMHHKRLVIPFERPALVDQAADARREIPLAANGWAGVLIRRRAIQAVGLPRKDFFVFCDDMEYTYRISQSFRVFLIPGSKVVHKSDSRWVKKAFSGRAESVRWPSEQPWRLYYEIRNRVFFVTRHARIWTLPYVLPLILARKVAGVMLFDDGKLRRLRNLLRAAQDGILGRLREPAHLKGW